METIFRRTAMAGLALVMAFPTLANAQDISLTQNSAADQFWKGTKPNANAGAWMDLGDLSGDARRDLIVGSPGTASVAGTVYVIYGGPDRTGEKSLATADVVIASTVAGTLFGFSTAAGNVLNADGANPKNLAIGAPGASGGRGAVYLYAAGWAPGTHLTQANATYTIIGAPGDQLGTALATGDLDKDGHRELIIGAPGNNRVYVIKGSATLSGTIDLSVTPAAATFVATGIGRSLIAGDVTNDGIYDLLVGSPALNLIFGYVGTVGAIPTVPAISYTGVNAGDEVGASIRLLDIDDDGKTDLVIGAPGGDGPGNGRPNAGNIYLFLGPLTNGAHSVSEAPIVFYGAGAQYRAGDKIATGDINRDTPNDLAIIAPGAVNGAGEIDIYYGRPRNTIGTLIGATRIVDLNVAGQVNRHIFGDPAAGAIGSAQVYEVTGEGARDIIVGIPAIEGNTGKLYFTISPRLQLSRFTQTLVANRGGTATSSIPVDVLNPSVVITGWQATSTSPWLTASPASGSVVQTSPGAFYIVGSAGALPGGVYTGTLNVSATSPDLTMIIPIQVTMTVLDAKVSIDAPANGAVVSNGFAVGGWALDLAAPTGTGVNSVQAYAFPTAGGAGIYLGTASYGLSRPDVGAAFGARFTNSGYGLTVRNLTPGASYRLVVFAKSTVTNSFATSSTVNITVSSSSAPAGPTPADPNSPPLTDPNAPGGPGGGPGPVPIPTADTRVNVNRSGLTFGATNNGTLRSGAQSVTVGFIHGASTWTVSSNVPWLNLSPAAGSGAGSFKVTVNDGVYRPGEVRTGTLTITAPGVANSPLTVPVSLTAFQFGANPFGLIDTPADNSTGVVGSLPVTGWAIDDIGIGQVTLWRDPLPGEPASSANGKVFIGNAGQVEGARPDIDATYNMPFDYQAGWGYLLLTNMLPGQGNGTFKLYAFATDLEGHSVLLGSKTITCDNAHATRPFGSIDTPDQGGTVAGTAYVNFGWALTPVPNAIPTNGSTMNVFIDGVPVGHPVYNNPRGDISTLFPGRANSNGPVGFFQFNTTGLANGVHTIAWGVVDGAGNAEGIGSRYFTVLNGSASSVLSSSMGTGASTEAVVDAQTHQGAAAAGESIGQPVSALETAPIVEQPAYVQSGFTSNASLDLVETVGRAPGRVKTEELGLVRVTIGSPVADDSGGYEGYLVKGTELSALPAGSFLDKHTGEFFWQPGPGFVGSYDFVFVRTGNGAKTRTPLSVDIAPRKHDTEVLLPSRVIRK